MGAWALEAHPAGPGPRRWEGEAGKGALGLELDLAKTRSTRGEASELLLVTEEQRRQQQVYGDGRRERLPGTWDLGATLERRQAADAAGGKGSCSSSSP